MGAGIYRGADSLSPLLFTWYVMRPMSINRVLTSLGFHKNIFRASLRVLDVKSPQSLNSVIRENICWDLTHVTGTELDELRQSRLPHIVISGNSLDGETSDYMDRLPTTRLHADSTCEDNMQHCKALLASDQDRNVLAIFADHRHYGFALSGEENKQGEESVVHDIMDSMAPGLSEQLRRSKNEARVLGTGPSMKLFMWQHVVLESPGRYLQLLDQFDRPVILGAPILTQELVGFR